MATYAQVQPNKASLLRRMLQANSIFCALSGVTFIAAAGPLAALVGLPAPALLITGVILLPYALFLWYGASKERIDHRLAWAAIILDALWVVDSAIILATGWLPLTNAGWWIVLGLAVIVALFAELQYIGLRRLQRQ